MEFQEGHRQKLLRETPKQVAEQLLMDALGGQARGVLSVAVPYQPDTGAVIWDSITVFVRSEELAEALVQRLTSGIQGLGGKLNSVKWKKQARPKVTSVGRQQRSGPAGSRDRTGPVAPIERIKAAILQDIHDHGPATFPSMTRDDLSIQWVGVPATDTDPAIPQTTLDDLLSFEEDMGDTSRDLRRILEASDLVVTAEVLFKAIIELNSERAIRMESASATDDNRYHIWSSLRYKDTQTGMGRGGAAAGGPDPARRGQRATGQTGKMGRGGGGADASGRS